MAYSIGDVSRVLGITASALHYYEKEGLISGVERSQGGFRQYSDEDLERLGSMSAVREAGLYRSEGKDYVMKDGDIVLFRFNV